MLLIIVVAGLVVAWSVPLPGRLFAKGSRMVEYHDGAPMYIGLSPDDKWRIRSELSEIDPDYIKALIRYEDKRFRYHPGVDPMAVVRALYQNISAGRIVSGASTITMQLVRLVEPRPRTLKSKIIESLRATQLELRFDKDEILNLYINFLPFGENIEGVGAASLAYFGHLPRELSPFEISYLLSVPQKPSEKYPCEKNSERAQNAVESVISRLSGEDVFTAKEAKGAKEKKVPSSLKPFPRRSMHVAGWLLRLYPANKIKSTIRREHQSIAESVLLSYRDELKHMGIYNASVIVVDNENGNVTAAVGNFDFWDKQNEGQVVGFNAPRSPGSAMKPFIYAMAIDRGMVLPGYMVADVPTNYRGYDPINYDGKFHGLITLRDALANSYNVPFVNLLHKIGLENYLNFLRKTGITTINDEPDYYGLSVAVGGLEVTLAELTNIYAMLARGGEYIPLRWTRNAEAARKSMLAPGAAYLTRKTLELRDRPDFPERTESVPSGKRIFWKTGTSAHHKDAWSIGATRRYTAGVWVGNFDGTPSRRLVGALRAGPILFDILQNMPHGTRGDFSDKPPADLIPVEVCAWSGRIAGEHCPHRKTVPAIRTSIPTRKCPYHVEYPVDADTGHRLNPSCTEGRRVVMKSFLVLPASVRRWASDEKLDAAAPPPLSKSCRKVTSEGELKILTPKRDTVFLLVPGIKSAKQRIPLKVEAGANIGELFWFVDDHYFASGPPHRRVWLEPEPGEHKIRVMDISGSSDSVVFKVVSPG